MLFAAHVTSTAAGAAASARLAVDPIAWGFDAALPALFLVLLWPHLRRAEGRIAAALGAIIAVALIFVHEGLASIPPFDEDLEAATAGGPEAVQTLRAQIA